MSLLPELIQSLFPEELANIKRMRLEGKQKAVLDLVIEKHALMALTGRAGSTRGNNHEPPLFHPIRPAQKVL